MKVPSGFRASRAWPVALTAAVLLAISLPLAGPAQAQKTRADRCSEALQKDYGVAATSGVSQHNASNRRSAYASGTLENGDTVRFRCLFSERGTPEVQVFAPAPRGGSRTWPRWGSADAYLVPPKADAPPPEPEPAEAEQTPPEAQGPHWASPEAGS